MEDNSKIPEKLQEKYSIDKILGEGTYGIVLKGICKQTGKIFALKQTKLTEDDEGIPGTSLREICILKEVQNHPNIVKMVNLFYEPLNRQLWLIFEFIEMDLYKFIKQYRLQDQIDKETQQLIPCNIEKKDIKKIMYQIVNGMYHCHRKGVIHRDLKPQNVLITKDIDVKIADFGLARQFSLPIKKFTREVETLWYRAPELLLGAQTYALGVDIWSVGCIFYELYNKKPLFKGSSEIEQIFKIFQFHGTPTENDWPELKKLRDYQPTFPKFRKNPDFQKQFTHNMDFHARNFFMDCLAIDPNKRISMKDALNHTYFSDLETSFKKNLRPKGN